MAEMGVQLDVTVDEQTMEKMIYAPDNEFRVKLVRRDATYKGSLIPPLSFYVYNIIEV